MLHLRNVIYQSDVVQNTINLQFAELFHENADSVKNVYDHYVINLQSKIKE